MPDNLVLLLVVFFWAFMFIAPPLCMKASVRLREEMQKEDSAESEKLKWREQ